MALEFSQKLHLWFKLHTKFLHNNSLNIRHQRGNIFRCGISCIDHETAMLLRNAENNEVGLIRVRRSIGSVFSLDSDDKLIDTVQQYICIAINREETCADIARRYQYFGMNGGIM